MRGPGRDRRCDGPRALRSLPAGGQVEGGSSDRRGVRDGNDIATRQTIGDSANGYAGTTGSSGSDITTERGDADGRGASGRTPEGGGAKAHAYAPSRLTSGQGSLTR